MIKKIKELLTGKYNIIDILYYIQGNYRYWLFYKYYGKKPKLMRQHIWEQINYRIQWMDDECYAEGSCKICSCETTALQMCNKSCDKPCYPPIMNKEKWDRFFFKRESVHYINRKTRIIDMWKRGNQLGNPRYFKYDMDKGTREEINLNNSDFKTPRLK